MSELLAALVVLVTVHQIDGREVQINPRQVVSIATPRDADAGRALVEGVRCVISFVDGKFLSVSETCHEVRTLIGGGDAE